MWEEAVRVPLIIRDPRYPSRTVNALVELIDLVPTILEALGVPPMPGQQGKSLRHLLRGGEEKHRDVVFSEYLDDHRAMVRDERWKYVITSGKHDLALGYATGFGPSGRFETLYDLQEDPGEFHNLAGDSDRSEVLSEMRARMLGSLPEHTSECRGHATRVVNTGKTRVVSGTARPDPVTRKGFPVES